MAIPDPIPYSLWRRLARLDARCDISLDRRDTARRAHRLTSGKNYPREWEVRIGLRADPRGPLFVEGPALADVLATAVERAEARGWHLPAAPQAAPPGPIAS